MALITRTEKSNPSTKRMENLFKITFWDRTGCR